MPALCRSARLAFILRNFLKRTLASLYLINWCTFKSFVSNTDYDREPEHKIYVSCAFRVEAKVLAKARVSKSFYLEYIKGSFKLNLWGKKKLRFLFSTWHLYYLASIRQFSYLAGFFFSINRQSGGRSHGVLKAIRFLNPCEMWERGKRLWPVMYIRKTCGDWWSTGDFNKYYIII